MGVGTGWGRGKWRLPSPQLFFMQTVGFREQKEKVNLYLCTVHFSFTFWDLLFTLNISFLILYFKSLALLKFIIIEIFAYDVYNCDVIYTCRGQLDALSTPLSTPSASALVKKHLVWSCDEMVVIPAEL